MTDVQTFKAENLQAALDLVRAKLGSDSVILHTRQVSRRHWMPFRKPIVEVEITASKEMQPHVRTRTQKKLTKASPQQNNRKPAQKRKAPQQSQQAGIQKQNESVASRMASNLQDQDDLDSVSISPQIKQMVSSVSNAPQNQTTPKTRKTLNRPASQPTAPNKRVTHSERNPKSNRTTVPQRTLTSQNITAPQRTTISQKTPEKIQQPESPRPQVSAPRLNTQTNIPGFDASSMNEFASKLESIEKMIQHLGRNQQIPASNDIPNEVFQLYSELIDSGVDHETARSFAVHLKEQATAEQLESYEESHRLLTSLIESTIRVSGPIEAVRGKRKVVALIGATGVGKTTTLAKLAGNFRLRTGIKVGLVTVDTYRVAAVDQLRTYAEIIDLPMKVVKNNSEMRQALDDFTGLDLVLIDTAGRSPRDELQIQELKSILAEAQADEVHLVMSLTSSIQTLKATIQKFAPANPTSLVITKLDEAGGMGPLLSLMHQVSVPISYLTMGQDVPDDIEAGQPHRIAKLITGKEQLFSVY